MAREKEALRPGANAFGQRVERLCPTIPAKKIMTGPLALGIEIGGTYIAAAMVDASAELRSKVHRVATPPGNATLLFDAAVALARQVDPGSRAFSAGIGSADAFDANGTVTSATALLPGWVGTPVAETLCARLQIPVVALNDVHAAALGESAVGAARGVANALLVAIGTGVGGAVILNRRLLTGARGLAGSIGHQPVPEAAGIPCSCGGIGHLEGISRGPALEALYAAMTGRRVALADLPDDREAGAVLKQAAGGLGSAIAAASALFEPEVIVIGGGVAELGDRLIVRVRREFAMRAFPPASQTPIVRATLGATAAIVGAALASLDRSAGSLASGGKP